MLFFREVKTNVQHEIVLWFAEPSPVLYNFLHFLGGRVWRQRGGRFRSGSHYTPFTFSALFFTKYFHSTHTITLLSPYILFPLLLSLAEETGLVLGIQLTIFYVSMLECVCMCVSVILWSLSLLASSRAVSLKAAH